jgi:O-antigen ligase
MAAARTPLSDRSGRLDHALDQVLILLAFSLPTYRPWVSLGAPLFALLWLARGGLRSRIRPLARHLPTLAVLTFLGLNVLSLSWSAHPAEGLSYLAKYRYLLLIPMVAITVHAATRDRVLASFEIGACVATALSWAAVAGWIHTADAGPSNPAVTMSHLDLSMVLAAAAVVALDRLSRAPSARSVVLHAAALAWIVSGLAVNIGRSGQVALLAGATLWTAVRFGRTSPRRLAAGVAAVWLAFGALYLGVPRLRDRVDSAWTEVRDAVAEQRYASNQGMRIAGLRVGWDVFREHPLLGVGVGDTLPELTRVLDDRHPELAPVLDQYRRQHLHNQYLQIGVELGLVGLAVVVVLLASVIVQRPAIPPFDRALAAGLAAAFAVGFLGDPFLRKQMVVASFAVLVGVVTAIRTDDADELPAS